MLKGTPVVAVRKREEALYKFSDKLKKLEELLDTGSYERLPKRMLATTFVTWEDEALGVKKLSRNLLYGKTEEYTVLHLKLENLLKAFAKVKNKGSKKEDNFKKQLERLEAAERRAQVYVNDYSIVKAELEEKIKEIARLEQQLARVREKSRKITPLQVVRANNDL